MSDHERTIDRACGRSGAGRPGRVRPRSVPSDGPFNDRLSRKTPGPTARRGTGPRDRDASGRAGDRNHAAGSRPSEKTPGRSSLDSPKGRGRGGDLRLRDRIDDGTRDAAPAAPPHVGRALGGSRTGLDERLALERARSRFGAFDGAAGLAGLGGLSASGRSRGGSVGDDGTRTCDRADRPESAGRGAFGAIALLAEGPFRSVSPRRGAKERRP